MKVRDTTFQEKFMVQRHLPAPRSQSPLQPRFATGPVARASCTAFAALAVQACLPTWSWALDTQPAGPIVAVKRDIPPGPLGRALAIYAAQAGVALSFDAALTDGLHTQGLTGQHSLQQGFEILLAGSGLECVRDPQGGYALRRAPSQDKRALPVLPTVVVRASATDDSAERGYLSRRNGTATKTDTDNLEIAQAISVVTREQIDDQGAAPALQDTLRYTPGLFGTRGVNLTDDSFNVRGFAAGLATSSNTPVFRDGLRQAPAMYASTVEPYGLERIDVLRGPGSVLFGQVTPGGLVNVLSKRPTTEALRELEVQAGNHNHRQVGLDLADKLDDAGEWAYRLTAMARDANTQTRYIPNDRRYVAPAISWHPSADTTLTLLSNYQYTRTAYNWGLPVAGSLLANPNGQLSRHSFTGEPLFDRYTTKTWSLGYLFEHRFNNTWSLRQNARYYKSDMVWNSAYGSGLQAANQRLLNRFAFIRADEYKSFNVDTQLQANWSHGDFEHTSLAGLDYADVPWLRNERRGTVAALDLYNPVYGAAITPNAQPSRILHTDATQLGLYAQEQLKFRKHWVLMAGLRHDQARSSITGTLTNGSATSPVQSVAMRNDVAATTGRIGAVYLFDSGWAPYVSAATSFEPESGALDYNGNPFEPTRGRQYEAGMKYEAPDSPLSMSLAVFDLRRTNVLTADPAHTGYSVQAGEIKSKGLEFEAKAKIAHATDLIGAYTFTDAKITRSNNGDQGTAPPGVPRHNIALWALHRVAQDVLPGLKVGAGLRHIIGTSGYVLGSTPTPAQLPSYTVVDAMAGYDRGAWSITLNIGNLFDKVYVQSCYYATTTCFYGDGRSGIARVTYRW